MRAPSLLVLVLVVTAPLAHRAEAKPSPAPAKVKADPAADALLKKGVELRRRGRDAEALEVFRAAYARAPSPRALAQIGLAEQALGAWLDADEHVAAALEAGADPWIAEHRPTLEDALGKIRAHVGRIEVTTDVAGARLFADDTLVGPLPLAAPLRHLVGPVKLRVEADGFTPKALELTVPADDVVAAKVDLAPSAPRPDPALAQREAERARARAELARSTARPLRPYAWATLGGAALGVGAGVGALIVRAGHVSRYNDDALCLPPNGLTREENCAEERSAADSAQTIATVGLAAGGALAVTSVLLFLLDGGDGPASTAALGPGPGDVGVAVRLALP